MTIPGAPLRKGAPLHYYIAMRLTGTLQFV